MEGEQLGLPMLTPGSGSQVLTSDPRPLHCPRPRNGPAKSPATEQGDTAAVLQQTAQGRRQVHHGQLHRDHQNCQGRWGLSSLLPLLRPREGIGSRKRGHHEPSNWPAVVKSLTRVLCGRWWGHSSSETQARPLSPWGAAGGSTITHRPADNNAANYRSW